MRTYIRRAVVFAFALAWLALPLGAKDVVREEMLVSADWLQRNLPVVKVLYVGDRAGYDAGHIPGAVFVDAGSLIVERDGTPNELPPIAALERVFRAAGIGARGRIVIYSVDPLLAPRTWFTLDYLGHGSRAALLDGGLAKWMAEERPLSRDPVVATPAAFEAHTVPGTVMRIGTLREVVRLQQQLGPNLVIIDARTHAQFTGDEPGYGVRRPGHIPGAVNVPYMNNYAADDTLRPAAELRRMYQQAGVTKESANIAYCRTGMQASVTYFALRYLGFDATLYDGSYVEWSNAGESTGSITR